MPRYDWDELRTEWLSGNESLETFRKRKGLSTRHFWQTTKKQGWLEARQDVSKRVVKKVEASIINNRVDRWNKCLRLLDALHAQAYAIVKQTINEKGSIVNPMTPQEQKAQADAIKTLIQVESLITGGPTERIESKNLNINVLSAAVDLIERGGDDNQPI